MGTRIKNAQKNHKKLFVNITISNTSGHLHPPFSNHPSHPKRPSFQNAVYDGEVGTFSSNTAAGKKERKPAFHNESFPNRTYIEMKKQFLLFPLQMYRN